jgi:tRNA pseudouridine38-40 synthase
MAARLKLIVAYDGAPFSGWQSQANRSGIQDHLEKALAKICGKPVRVHGAGRTDAGVHAVAQVAHADIPVRRYAPDRWVNAINGLLPAAIRVMQCRFVADSFHARFSAKGKIYRYRIWNAEVAPPLENGRAWHVRERLDIARMTEAAQLFVGRHDYSAFAANRGAPVSDPQRTIYDVRVRRAGPLITMEFDGEGFLYKMARMMTAAMVQVGHGKISSSEIRQRLASNPQADNSQADKARREVAPAAGLFLFGVRY